MKMKQKIFTLALAVFFLICSSYIALASVTKTDTITIIVNVSELTMVDINPTELAWTGAYSVPPGGEGVEKVIVIENIGSTNITKIWFNNSYPSSRPFGSGTNATYDAGNFVVIRRNETGEIFYFPNRVEYNESLLPYINPPSDWDAFGRFRNSSYEYFWFVAEGTNNCSDGTFYIGKNPHTQTETGTDDFSSCDPLTGTGTGKPCRNGTFEGQVNINGVVWGWADVYIGPDTGYENYTVAVNAYCNETWFYHWNMDAPGATELTNDHAEYFITQPLYPGAHVNVNVRIRVPFGVAYGFTPAGTLTVIAFSEANA